MGYEAAPATKMLATHCAICSRPLLDAQSVELGIGPICAGRAGYDPSLPGRDQANIEIHAIAMDLSHAQDKGRAKLPWRIARLRELNFGGVADAILRNLAEIRITPDESGHGLWVETPYRADMISAFRRIPGRRWVRDQEGKGGRNHIPNRPDAKNALWRILRQGYPKALGIGPKGIFVVE